MSKPAMFPALAVCMSAATCASAQVTFEAVPYQSTALAWTVGAATPDLSVMVGSIVPLGSPSRAARWTSAGEFAQLPLIPNGFTGDGTGVSHDGTIVVGYGSIGTTSISFRWTAAGGIQVLDPGDGFTTARVRGISGDGSVLFGTRGTLERAMLWRPDGPYEIPLVEGYGRGYTTSISHDGNAATGYSNPPGSPFRAFHWTQSGGTLQLDPPPEWSGSTASRISGDGQTVFGHVNNESNQYRAYRWTESGGMQLIPELHGSAQIAGVSFDGTVMVGTHSPSGQPRPFYWSLDGGLFDIADVLALEGVDLTGWLLDSAGAVSVDGRTVAGGGRYQDIDGQFYRRIWTATIPSPSSLLVLLFAAPLRRRRR